MRPLLSMAGRGGRGTHSRPSMPNKRRDAQAAMRRRGGRTCILAPQRPFGHPGGLTVVAQVYGGAAGRPVHGRVRKRTGKGVGSLFLDDGGGPNVEKTPDPFFGPFSAPQGPHSGVNLCRDCRCGRPAAGEARDESRFEMFSPGHEFDNEWSLGIKSAPPSPRPGPRPVRMAYGV